ncbi:aldose 1-epimerase family protein [Zavarzinia sp. CC-PAN008]|uniref:aldose epimerase family protein n=1 Tax=Zavarzinia sp. CC-PAN008 TaxID=3243332 RepID=UPI003F74387F
MTEPTAHPLSNGRARARIAAHGAELVALELDGVAVLWSGDPAHWGRHAPILFPFIGRLPDGGLALPGGGAIALPQHGFARDRDFAWTTRDKATCSLRLEADAATRAAYPFDFRLDVTHALEPDALTTTVRVTNTGAGAMPFTFGFHPALHAPPGAMLELPERARATLLSGGLLDPARTRSVPAALALPGDWFADDALIVPGVPFGQVQYRAPGLPPLVVGWSGCDTLALWSRPGSPFLCIEPWAGTPAHVGTTGTADHPGLRRLGPGAAATFTLRIALALRAS